jgi:hypothetical protein|tara:strand:+ start:274 stop:588 length:315 start_codon:yes stop_codon:yes gene_type:complete
MHPKCEEAKAYFMARGFDVDQHIEDLIDPVTRDAFTTAQLTGRSHKDIIDERFEEESFKDYLRCVTGHIADCIRRNTEIREEEAATHIVGLLWLVYDYRPSDVN